MSRADTTQNALLAISVFMIFVILVFHRLGLLSNRHVPIDPKQKKILDNDMRVNRSLECTVMTRIRDALTGQVVKIGGKIEASGKTLRAPLSKRECVFYDVVVEQYWSAAPDVEKQWLPLFRDTKAVDFYIVDDTDRALIKQSKLSRALRAAAEKDHNYRSEVFNNASPEFESYLKLHGHSSKVLGVNRTLRYREGVFELGERVVAMGTAMREHSAEPTNPGAGYRGAGQAFILGPLDGGTVLISDSDYLNDPPVT